MEQLTLDADYKDPVKADATWNSWWLYSKDHVLPTAYVARPSDTYTQPLKATPTPTP